MDEKKLISLTDEIVDALVNISMGRGKMKALIPGSVTRKLVKDEALFNSVKECYINYLSGVFGKIDDREELKTLSDFRYELESIYNGGDGTNEKIVENEETTEEN